MFWWKKSRQAMFTKAFFSCNRFHMFCDHTLSGLVAFSLKNLPRPSSRGMFSGGSPSIIAFAIMYQIRSQTFQNLEAMLFDIPLVKPLNDLQKSSWLAVSCVHELFDLFVYQSHSDKESLCRTQATGKHTTKSYCIYHLSTLAFYWTIF